MSAGLDALIAATHGAEAADVHRRYVLTDPDRGAAIEAGREVLTVFPPMPGACVMMSALLSGRFEALVGRPAYVVAGSLHVGPARVFGDDAPIDGVQRFSRADPSWDGHAWMALGPYLVDLSIFRTAYSRQSPPLLAQFVRREFGEGRGLLMDRADSLAAHGLVYQPQYVLSHGQVTGLIGGAMTMIPR